MIFFDSTVATQRAGSVMPDPRLKIDQTDPLLNGIDIYIIGSTLDVGGGFPHYPYRGSVSSYLQGIVSVCDDKFKFKGTPDPLAVLISVPSSDGGYQLTQRYTSPGSPPPGTSPPCRLLD